jgi:cold shock protein
MPHGTIKRLIMDKGFGFILQDEGREEYFFHRSAVRGTFEMLHEGQRVSYEVGQGAKGPRAEDVRAI